MAGGVVLGVIITCPVAFPVTVQVTLDVPSVGLLVPALAIIFTVPVALVA